MPLSSTELSPYSVAEKLLLAEPQVGCVVTHHFGPGVYIRVVTVEAGVFAVSHHHKKEHLNMVLAGCVAMQQGDEPIQVISAPYLYTAPPGRKMGLVLQKLVWANVFATKETDVELLEAQLLDKSPAFLDLAGKIRAAQGVAREADRKDFFQFLDEYNATPEQARELSELEDDLIPMPAGHNIVIRESALEGKGVFAQTLILPGGDLGPARLNGKRTPLGRYLNHSRTPNATMEERGGNAYVVAVAPINPFCSETVPGDEITVDYRQVLSLAGRLI